MPFPSRSRRSWKAPLAAVLAGALALVGCSSAPEPAPEPSVSAPAPEADIPSTPAGEKTRLILDILNAEEDVAPEAWSSLMAPESLAQLTPEQLSEVVNLQLRPARPFAATGYQGTDTQAITRIEGQGVPALDLQLALDGEGLIQTLLFTPAPEPVAPAASLEEVTERLDGLDAEVRALVLRGHGADAETVLARDAETSAPLASVMKLYVLGAVVDAIDAGALSWDDTVTVTDATRSLPTGELQDLPAGTEVSVRDAAQKMIEISDNTATDLLIERVGRDRVEAAVAAFGHHDPVELRPFATTREVFELAWGEDADRRERWLAGDEAARRAVLAELAGTPLSVDPATIDGTAWDPRLSWRGSAQDVARAQAALYEAGGRHPEVREILGANPGAGLDFDRAAWPYIAFKGGSAPGVLTGSWLGEDAEGRTVTVVLLGESADAATLTTEQGPILQLAPDLLRLAG